MDSDGKFPISKIKAQLLRDDDVGRVSTKAVELIAACSALFVSDLARSTTEASHTRKRKSSSKNTIAKDVTLVTLAQIKKSVKTQKEYSFLEGALDGVTEKSAFQYDAAAAKKRKRLEDNNNNTKQKNNSRKKTKPGSKLPAEARGSNNDNDVVENRALREAIETETSVTSQNTHGQNKEIIEDDDDYD